MPIVTFRRMSMIYTAADSLSFMACELNTICYLGGVS